jgi:uncharacterized protein (DUF433 family)
MDGGNRKRDFSVQLFVPGGEGEEKKVNRSSVVSIIERYNNDISRRKNMFTHITYSPDVLAGKPHIAGTRLSIEFILELFASGATKDEVLKAYPHLTREAVEEALKYAAQSVKNEILLDVKLGA